MKILSAEQIRRTDQFTIENEPIASIDLMERASERFSQWFIEHYHPSQKVIIVCGSGNNGGDGLAVGRLLLAKGFDIDVYVITKGKKGSPDFEKNKNRLEGAIPIHELSTGSDLPSPAPGDIVIDGIFGSGLTRSAEGLHAEIIDKINASESTIVSIDIASGLFCDEFVENPKAIKPSVTISFQLPKQSFFIRENAAFVGDWKVVDIGLDQDFISRQESNFHWITIDLVKSFYKNRSRHSHKGNFGHSLIIAGSRGKIGAAVLAGKACLRSGSGLLNLMVPACGTPIVQTALPEAMVLENKGDSLLEDQPVNFDYFTAVGIGPGIGQGDMTRSLLTNVLEHSVGPVVLDADALNLLGANQEMLEIIPQNSILTPHPKEFERIAGPFANSVEMIRLQQEFSQKRKVFVILKGGYTSIATPEGQVYFNTYGNPGMATAGSGDVLTGIVTGLLAQGYSPLHSALMGVFLHAQAGDLAAMESSPESLIAGDIISHLGPVFRLLSK